MPLFGKPLIFQKERQIVTSMKGFEVSKERRSLLRYPIYSRGILSMSGCKDPKELKSRLKQKLGLKGKAYQDRWYDLPQEASTHTQRIFNLPEMAPIRKAFKLIGAKMVDIRFEKHKSRDDASAPFFHKYYCHFQFPHTARTFKMTLDSRALAANPEKAHTVAAKHLSAVVSINDRLRRLGPGARRLAR